MNEALISIIVPVYKVEPYLRKCLDSIVNQTYKNLEIILVDDGSPDGCGKICDEYAAKDSRIKVIHKENGGLSSARNAGLEAATGDWIGWVDSDDWIEPDMYEYMLRNALKSGADIAICSHKRCYSNTEVFCGCEKETVLDRESAVKALLEDDIIHNYCWDKLWRKDLFNEIQFPEGRTYEDIAIVHRLFARTDHVICLPEAKYNYFQRPDSIMSDTSIANRINYFIAAKQRLDEMKDIWPQFLYLLESQCVASTVGIWCGYYSNPREERLKYHDSLKEIASFCREHYRGAINANSLGIAGKIVARLTPYPYWWAFAVSWLISRLYKIKHGRAL